MSRERLRWVRLMGSSTLDEPTSNQLKVLWKRVLSLLGGEEVIRADDDAPRHAAPKSDQVGEPR